MQRRPIDCRRPHYGPPMLAWPAHPCCSRVRAHNSQPPGQACRGQRSRRKPPSQLRQRSRQPQPPPPPGSLLHPQPPRLSPAEAAKRRSRQAGRRRWPTPQHAPSPGHAKRGAPSAPWSRKIRHHVPMLTPAHGERLLRLAPPLAQGRRCRWARSPAAESWELTDNSPPSRSARASSSMTGSDVNPTAVRLNVNMWMSTPSRSQGTAPASPRENG